MSALGASFLASMILFYSAKNVNMRIMPNVQTIYQQTILPLPKNDKLRLATIILQSLSSETEKTTSALDFLETLQIEKVFESADEVDRHLKAERESWDN